ncbi:MAG: hypothetical protein AB1347_12170, partial [Acidobacteriota bacterium]
HRSACASCALAADREEAARRGLAAFRDVTPPEDLHRKILSASARPSTGRLWRRTAWAAPIAAVLLLALLGGVTLVRYFRSSFSTEEGLRRPTVNAPQPAVERSQNGAPMGQGSIDPEKDPTSPRQESLQDSKALPPPAPRSVPAEGYDISPDLTEVHRKGEAKTEADGPAFSSAPFEIQSPGGSSDLSDASGAAPRSRAGTTAPPPSPSPSLFSSVEGKARSSEERIPEASAVPAPAPLVLCSLQTLDRTRYASLQLPEDAAPPPGTHWYVVVEEADIRSVADEKGRPVEGVLDTVAAAAQYLHLAPGRYRLKRLAE